MKVSNNNSLKLILHIFNENDQMRFTCDKIEKIYNIQYKIKYITCNWERKINKIEKKCL